MWPLLKMVIVFLISFENFCARTPKYLNEIELGKLKSILYYDNMCMLLY